MSEPIADVATAVALGARDRQEDAVLADFTSGAATGIAVLSDGMGGHDDGDLAARIIVSRIFAALSVTGRSPQAQTDQILYRLTGAVRFANESLRDHVDVGAGHEGMGGTVVTVVIENDLLHWISVGDSGLYLFRKGKLRRLNEIHSLAPQIDKMVEEGAMDRENARNHPQRGVLTSALVGAEIARIDCPRTPFQLEPDDVVLMASDGLEVLEPDRIRRILHRHRARSSQAVARALMTAIEAEPAPDKDNAAVVVIKPKVARKSRSLASAILARPFPLRPGFPVGLESKGAGIAASLSGRSEP